MLMNITAYFKSRVIYNSSLLSRLMIRKNVINREKLILDRVTTVTILRSLKIFEITSTTEITRFEKKINKYRFN